MNIEKAMIPVSIIILVGVLGLAGVGSGAIYDINGRKVDVLYDTNIDAGYHQLIWNANQFSSGVYFAVVLAGNYRSTQKIILLK